MTPLGGISGKLPPAGPTGRVAAPPAPAPRQAQRAGRAAAPSFAEQLRHSGGVRFSKHALQRVERRGIDSDGSRVQRLERGVDLAAGKGARDAVVMVDDTAYVVSVPNRTVITALDTPHMRDHVFTNIDSAVIA